MDERAYSCIAQIAATGGGIKGAGFLIPDGHVVTCAHVVNQALSRRNESAARPAATERVTIAFPWSSVSGHTFNGKVVAWFPLPIARGPSDSCVDIAVLQLDPLPPADIRPAWLQRLDHIEGQRVRTAAFPTGYALGRHAQGRLEGTDGGGWLQAISSPDDMPFLPGHSGAPVFLDTGGTVVAMVVMTDDSRRDVALLIPTAQMHRAWPPLIERTADARDRFSEITERLGSLSGNILTAVEEFLVEYLGSPTSPKLFGARDQVMGELNQWLDTPSSQRGLLVANAALGKSALLTRWAFEVACTSRAAVVFVPINAPAGTASLITILKIITARFASIHGERLLRSDNPLELLAQVDTYLRQGNKGRETPILLILDGLDEAVDWKPGLDFRIPRELGPGLKVIASARTQPDRWTQEWLRQLSWGDQTAIFSLEPFDKDAIALILSLEGSGLKAVATSEKLLDYLARVTEGSPYLLQLHIKELQSRLGPEHSLDALNLDTIVPGFEGYFEQWWADQRRRWGPDMVRKERAVYTVLKVLVYAFGPVTIEDLQELTITEQLDTWQIDDALEALDRLVFGGRVTQGYALNHPRLGEYFRSKWTRRDLREADQRFVTYGQSIIRALEAGELQSKDVPRYIVHHYIQHLDRADIVVDSYFFIATKYWYDSCNAHTAWRLFESHIEQLQRHLHQSSMQNLDALPVLVRHLIRSALFRSSVIMPKNAVPFASLVCTKAPLSFPDMGTLMFCSWMSPDECVSLITYIAPTLSDRALHWAFVIINTLDDPYLECKAFLGLIPYLPASLLRRALARFKTLTLSQRRDQLTEAAVSRLAVNWLQVFRYRRTYAN